MSPLSSPVLQQLNSLERSSPDFHDQLRSVLYGNEYVQCVPSLQGDDLAWLVDYLDEALGALSPSSPASRKCLRELRSISGTRGILPTSYTIASRLLTMSPDPFAQGGYGDVYQGTLDGSKVCIKRVRTYTQEGPEGNVKAFCKEAVTWKRLTHPNILHLLGVTITPFQLVSNWMAGGDLPGYIKGNPDAERVGLLCGVADGLCYLHSCNVIHGNLKGANILVDDSGHARIADFGLATITRDLDSVRSASLQHSYTMRWTAPEVLNGGKCSKEADVFAFAMVMIEVFTGERPSRPTHPTFTDDLWSLMRRCWDRDPGERPEAPEVFQIILTPVDPPAWKRLISHTSSMSERVDLMTSIFSDRNEVEVFKYLSGNDAQAFVDVIDEVLGSLDSLPPEIRRRCLRSSYRICGREAILPKSLMIPLCYDPMQTPHCHGGFADVWKGEHNSQVVAAKSLRVYSTSDLDRIRKRFCKEVMGWKTLRHPNVLPLVGVTMTKNKFVMVSEWMENGNINVFVKKYPDANRLRLLADVTKGLIYMHGRGIVHGDLKGANILIDNNSHACISDFSLLTIISDPQTLLSTCISGGTAPWMSPELLEQEGFGLEKSGLTKESDCYALGMVIYEVLSGRPPFAPSQMPILKILCGERPERPQGVEGASFTDGIWGMLQHCWNPQPSKRISAETVLPCLEGNPSPSWPDANDKSDVTAASNFNPLITRRVTIPDSGLPIVHSGNGLPGSSRGSLFSVASLAISQDNNGLPDPPQTNNHYPCGIAGLPIAHGGNGLPDSSRDSLFSVAKLAIPQDSGGLLDPPQTKNPKKGRVVGWLARIARRIFRTITRKPNGL